MTRKLSISVTAEHAQMIDAAVRSGDYASSSEVVREALRDWRFKQVIGDLWDEGIRSGFAEEGETIEDIKAAARREAGLD